MALRRWLSELLPKINFFRKILVDEQTALFIFEQLKSDRQYGDMMMNQAELWLLRGDWTYKKQYILELSDFYPSENQMRQFKEGTVTVTLALYRKKLMEAKESGKNEQRYLSEQQHFEQDKDKVQSETLLACLEHIKKLTDEKDALLNTNRRLMAVVEYLKVEKEEANKKKFERDREAIQEVQAARARSAGELLKTMGVAS